jgi:hypothetical protein
LIVNNFCRTHRPHYTEADAALKLNGRTEKENIGQNPFVKFFEYGYGAGKEGYWMYAHMALQFEDCIDAIQALYPQYDSLWMFDHRCGHDHGRKDGLNVANMSVMWGGTQSKVRVTEIKIESGFLGPHSPKLKNGDMQHMQFKEEDEGPYYMDPIQRQLRKYDEIKGMKSKIQIEKRFKLGATIAWLQCKRQNIKRYTRN